MKEIKLLNNGKAGVGIISYSIVLTLLTISILQKLNFAIDLESSFTVVIFIFWGIAATVFLEWLLNKQQK